MAKTTDNNSNSRLIKLMILLILLFTLLLGGVLVYFLVLKPNADREVKGGQREAAALQGSIQRMTDEEIQEALNNIVEEGMFRISIASDIIAEEDGLAELRIENNIQNRYIMQVSLYRDDNGAKIYSTDLIDPGYYIQTAELDEHLEPGEYACTAIFTALYPDTEEVVGTVGANVNLYVFPAGSELPAQTTADE